MADTGSSGTTKTRRTPAQTAKASPPVRLRIRSGDLEVEYEGPTLEGDVLGALIEKMGTLKPPVAASARASTRAPDGGVDDFADNDGRIDDEDPERYTDFDGGGRLAIGRSRRMVETGLTRVFLAGDIARKASTRAPDRALSLLVRTAGDAEVEVRLYGRCARTASRLAVGSPVGIEGELKGGAESSGHVHGTRIWTTSTVRELPGGEPAGEAPRAAAAPDPDHAPGDVNGNRWDYRPPAGRKGRRDLPRALAWR